MSKQLWEVPEMEWTYTRDTVDDWYASGDYEIYFSHSLKGWIVCLGIDAPLSARKFSTLAEAQAACVADRDARLEALGARKVIAFGQP